MGKGSRTKGKSGEIEAAEHLRELLGDQSIKRALGQARDGGADLEGDMITPYWHVEVKRTARTMLGYWFDKAQEDNRIPLIMWRPDRGQWRYFIELSEDNVRRLIRVCHVTPKQNED